jgi:phage shock protein PspC (stress-responsive transcriptional regulator)
MKNTMKSFEMTREAQRALSDFFEQLCNQADKCSVKGDVYEDLVSSLDEHISCALRQSCDRRHVETVDAQIMLEVLLAVGTPIELIEALDAQPAASEDSGSKKTTEITTSRTAHHDYAFPRYRVLKRSSKDRWLMGVCGGFAEYWGVSSLLLRFLMLFSGIGFFAYIIIGLIMPPDDCPEKAAPARTSAIFSTIQSALKIIFVIFMLLVLYLPLSGALLSVAAAGFFKILSEIGIAGWQSNDLWFYFVTGVPGYLAGLAGLVAGLGFFALLTQYFTSTFFNKSLLNINTRKLITSVAVSGLIVLSAFWIAASALREHAISDNLSHVFAASNVRAIDLAFPGSQMPFYRKSVQLVGDAAASEIKVEIVRKVGGRNENQAAANLQSLGYFCELSDDGKLKLGGNIDKPAWNLYPFPEITFLVKVPEQQLLKISCEQSAGDSCDVDISKVSGPVNIDLKNGKVRLDSVSSPDISVKSQVGSIDLQKVQADSLDVTSNVGKVRFSGVRATKARIKTSVGAIRVDSFVGNELIASSEVGSIRLENFSASKVNLETRTGAINIKADALKAGSELNVTSEVGAIRAELPADSKPSLATNSRIGKIHNAFKDTITDADSPKIQMNTNVGSIRITKAELKTAKPGGTPALQAENLDTED